MNQSEAAAALNSRGVSISRPLDNKWSWSVSSACPRHNCFSLSRTEFCQDCQDVWPVTQPTSVHSALRSERNAKPSETCASFPTLLARSSGRGGGGGRGRERTIDESAVVLPARMRTMRAPYRSWESEAAITVRIDIRGIDLVGQSGEAERQKHSC